MVLNYILIGCPWFNLFRHYCKLSSQAFYPRKVTCIIAWILLESSNVAWIIEWILFGSSNEYCLNYRSEWILLEFFHKCRRESNTYQGEFIEFCYKFIECIEQNQIYLNFIVNMWKLSNAYTRLRILTHFGNHRLKRRKWINVKKYVHIRNNHQLDSRFLLRLFPLFLWLYFYHSLLIL